MQRYLIGNFKFRKLILSLKLLMKNPISPLILFVFILTNFNINAQNIHLKSKSEKVSVLEDSTFVNEISIIFKESNEERLYPIFYDSELEKISDIQLSEKKRKRFKDIDEGKIYEEDVKLDYITSQKVKSLVIPPNKKIKLTYSLTCKELMYFSSLYFFSYNEIDTLNYQIKIPKKFSLAHNTIYKDSLRFYKIDSIKTDSISTWNIKVKPLKVKSDPLQFFGIYKNMKVPLMRTLVMPNSYKNKPTKYMNDWYYKNLIEQKGLTPTIKEKIDELTVNVTDPKKITNIIFNYVKSNFKYVAIEIGLGAFIPTHANEVFANKQGDCKDLSNFLSEALRYKGIKSDVALAATFDHISDCDFPSLSSANHVICIAYLDGKKVLLDPTDPIHTEGYPVQSLQERTILIINSKEGSFYKVKNFTPKQNEVSYEMDLKIEANNTINGNFKIEYNGISDNYLKRDLKSESKKDFENSIKLLYESVFGNQSITNLSQSNKVDNLLFKGNISIVGKTFSDNLNKYLFIDYLPRLFETETRETLIEGTYLYNPFYKKVRVNITLDEPIAAFNSIKQSFGDKDVSLNLEIKSKSNLEIECNYDFIFNHIFVENNNVQKINKILESFKKIINEPIVLKKNKS